MTVSLARFANKATFLFLVLTVLLLPLKSAHAQTINFFRPYALYPPEAIVAEAKRAAVISGRTLTGPPTFCQIGENGLNGNLLWMLTWVINGNTVVVNVKVERKEAFEQTIRAISYQDDCVFAEMMAARKNGLSATISLRDAQNTLNQLAAQLPLPYTGCKNSIEREGEGKNVSWRVVKSQYIDNHLVPSRRLDGNIEPYKGRFYRWFMNDYGTIFAPTGPLLAERRARQIASDAVTTYAASFLTPLETIHRPEEPGWVGWQEFSGSSTLTRIVYWYTFDLPCIADPNKNNPGTKWHGRNPMVFTARIDAETGEVWQVYHEVDGGRYIKQGVSVVSPRYTLFYQIGRDNSLRKTALLFAGGKPIRAVEPSKAARRFDLTITPSYIPDVSRVSETIKKAWLVECAPRTVTFTFNGKAQCVTWETAPGKWAGLALSPAQTADFVKWLAARSAQNKAIKK